MRMRSLILFSMSIISDVVLANTECLIQDAHYKYGWEGAGADFVMTSHASGERLSLHLFFKGVGSEWFLFDQGNARYVSLISTENVTSPGWTPPDPDSSKGRPLADQQFFAWNDDLKIVNDEPVRGSIAPEYFMVPGLPETLQFGQDKPVIIGAGVYKFDFCNK